MSGFGGCMKEYERISLDRFDGKNLDSTVYFLSHLHSDHTVGLDAPIFHKRLKTNKNVFLYCSEVTEVLLLASRKYKHLGPYIKSIAINTPTILEIPDPLFDEKETVTVTFLPAFHCPGSVMCMFEGHEGTVIYTGDFRWEHFQLEQMHHLRSGESVKHMKSLYIDTTFCTVGNLYIPSRQDCIDAVFYLVQDWISQSPQHVVYIGLRAQYGHEPLLNAVAVKLNKKVHVDAYKVDVYDNITEFHGNFTSNGITTQIHACSKQCKVEVDGDWVPCREQHARDKVLYILPTTMYFTQIQHLTLDKIIKRIDENFYRACYSFHSSYQEIMDLLAYLKPDKVFPNVKPPGDSSMDVIQHRLNTMLKECKASRDTSVTEDAVMEHKQLGTLKTRKGKADLKRKRTVSTSDSESLDFGTPVKERRVEAAKSQDSGVTTRRTRNSRRSFDTKAESQPRRSRRTAAAVEDNITPVKGADRERSVTPEIFSTPEDVEDQSSYIGSQRSESELSLTLGSQRSLGASGEDGISVSEASRWVSGSFLAAVSSSSVDETTSGCICLIDDPEAGDGDLEPEEGNCDIVLEEYGQETRPGSHSLVDDSTPAPDKSNSLNKHSEHSSDNSGNVDKAGNCQDAPDVIPIEDEMDVSVSETKSGRGRGKGRGRGRKGAKGRGGKAARKTKDVSMDVEGSTSPEIPVIDAYWVSGETPTKKVIDPEIPVIDAFSVLSETPTKRVPYDTEDITKPVTENLTEKLSESVSECAKSSDSQVVVDSSDDNNDDTACSIIDNDKDDEGACSITAEIHSEASKSPKQQVVDLTLSDDKTVIDNTSCEETKHETDESQSAEKDNRMETMDEHDSIDLKSASSSTNEESELVVLDDTDDDGDVCLKGDVDEEEVCLEGDVDEEEVAKVIGESLPDKSEEADQLVSDADGTEVTAAEADSDDRVSEPAISAEGKHDDEGKSASPRDGGSDDKAETSTSAEAVDEESESEEEDSDPGVLVQKKRSSLARAFEADIEWMLQLTCNKSKFKKLFVIENLNENEFSLPEEILMSRKLVKDESSNVIIVEDCMEDVKNKFENLDQNSAEKVDQNCDEKVDQNCDEYIDQNRDEEVDQNIDEEVDQNSDEKDDQNRNEEDQNMDEEVDQNRNEEDQNMDEDVEQNMDEDVEQNMDEDVEQNMDEKVDQNSDEDVEQNMDEKVDQNSDEEVDQNSDEVDQNSDEEVDKNSDEEVDQNSDEEVDQYSDEEVDQNSDEEVDQNSDEEVDKNSDEEVDQNSDEEVDQYSDEEVDQNSDEEVDQNSDEEVDKNSDEEVDQNSDEEVDQYSDEEVDQNSDEEVDQNSDEEVDQNSDEEVDQNSDKEVDKNSDEEVDQNSDEEVDKNTDEEVEQNRSEISDIDDDYNDPDYKPQSESEDDYIENASDSLKNPSSGETHATLEVVPDSDEEEDQTESENDTLFSFVRFIRKEMTDTTESKPHQRKLNECDKICDSKYSNIYIKKYHKSFDGKRGNERKDSRPYDTVHSCVFCKKLFTHIQHHLETMHGDEEMVTEIKKLKKKMTASGNKSQFKSQIKKLQDCLRFEGDHCHNLNVKECKEGELLIQRKSCHEEHFNVEEYGPCPECLQWIKLGSSVKIHQKNCPKSVKETSFAKKELIWQARHLIGEEHSSDRLRKEVFSKMNNDDIGTCAQSDDLICKLGEVWLSKSYNHPLRRGKDSSFHMRLAARLLTECRKRLNRPALDMIELLTIENFDTIVDATLWLCGRNEHDELKHPSTANKIGFDLARMVALKYGICLKAKDQDGIEDSDGFLKYMKIHWSTKVSTQSNHLLATRHFENRRKLPHPKDIEVVSTKLTEKLSSIDYRDTTQYAEVARIALIRLMVYNRRRSGEIEELKMTTYLKRRREVDDVEESLLGEMTTTEKYLIKSQELMWIRGKRGRRVPVLIPIDASEALAYITNEDVRKKGGVQVSNRYMFASRGDGVIRASECIKNFGYENASELIHPDRLTSTGYRAYMATIAQCLGLKDHQIQWLCTHMGHTLDVHQSHYRFALDGIERTQLGKLLLLQDKNLLSKYKDKELKDIEFEDIISSAEGLDTGPSEVGAAPSGFLDENEVELELHDMEIDDILTVDKEKRPKSKAVRVRWTEEETAELERYAKVYLQKRKTPSRKICKTFIDLSKKANGELHKRSADNVIKKISAMNVKARKKDDKTSQK